MNPPNPIVIEVAPGELVDRITILEIKRERVTRAEKLENVTRELRLLREARERGILESPRLRALEDQLRGVNARLWDIEDEIRVCERENNFGPRFVELARSVYHTNDQRAAIKRRINIMLGSKIVEEKEYVEYDSSGLPEPQ